MDARLCRPGPVWRSREQIPPHEGAGGGGRARVRVRSPETPSGAPWRNPRLASRQGQRPELRAAARSHQQHPTRVGAAACAAQTVHGPRRPRSRTRLCSAGRGLWTERRASAGGHGRAGRAPTRVVVSLPKPEGTCSSSGLAARSPRRSRPAPRPAARPHRRLRGPALRPPRRSRVPPPFPAGPPPTLTCQGHRTR